MKRDGKLTDVQLTVQECDRQNKTWKDLGIKSLASLLLVLGLVSCAPPKPAPTPSVEVTPSPSPSPSPSVKPSPKPKPSAAAPRSDSDASQSAGGASDQGQVGGGDVEPEAYTPKNKAIVPDEKSKPEVIKPAPAIEPDIAPAPRVQDPAPPAQNPPPKMAPIAPQPDTDPEPPSAR